MSDCQRKAAVAASSKDDSGAAKDRPGGVNTTKTAGVGDRVTDACATLGATAAKTRPQIKKVERFVRATRQSIAQQAIGNSFVQRIHATASSIFSQKRASPENTKPESSPRKTT
ncbi:MAG: hypothetical protein AAGK78_12200, partial [Planctomycetota bacterium]